MQGSKPCVAGGDLTLSGGGAANSRYHGLLWSSGALKVSDVTVVGSLVGGKDGTGVAHAMQVDRATVAYDPAAVSLNFQGALSPGRGGGNTGGVRWVPGQALDPASFYSAKNGWSVPSVSDLQDQIQGRLQFQLSGSTSWVSWSQLTPTQQTSIGDYKVTSAVTTVLSQIKVLAAANKPPSQDSYSINLDLNRFLTLSTRLHILCSRVERL